MKYFDNYTNLDEPAIRWSVLAYLAAQTNVTVWVKTATGNIFPTVGVILQRKPKITWSKAVVPSLFTSLDLANPAETHRMSIDWELGWSFLLEYPILPDFPYLEGFYSRSCICRNPGDATAAPCLWVPEFAGELPLTKDAQEQIEAFEDTDPRGRIKLIKVATLLTLAESYTIMDAAAVEEAARWLKELSF